jgi:hypothetical protein
VRSFTRRASDSNGRDAEILIRGPPHWSRRLSRLTSRGGTSRFGRNLIPGRAEQTISAGIRETDPLPSLPAELGRARFGRIADVLAPFWRQDFATFDNRALPRAGADMGHALVTADAKWDTKARRPNWLEAAEALRSPPRLLHLVWVTKPSNRVPSPRATDPMS